MVLDWKSSQQYPVDVDDPQASIFGPKVFLLYINDLPDKGISNIATCADDTSFYSKRDQLSWWQKLQLASELEYDLCDTVDWGRKLLVDFNAEKS